MLQNLLRTTAMATALALTGGAFATQAQAEVTYNRGNDTDPKSLDHQLTSTVAEAHISRDLFEGLLTKDAKAQLIPGAAEKWEVSDDGMTYTFHLRPGAKWSNGDPITAADFVYAYQRIMDPATAAEYANILFPIKNSQKVNKGEAKGEELGAKAIDDNTLEITLEAPTPYFLELLTHHSAYPIHKASVEKLGAEWTKVGNLVSNGAFMLDAFAPNDKLTLKKNPNFHDAANVKIDVVNYIPFEDRSACLRRFEANEVQSCSDVDAAQMDYMRGKLGDQLHIVPKLGTYYLPIKGKEGSPLKDMRVRQAISMIIDRDFLSKDIWRETMLPGYSLLPPGINNYPDPVFLEYKDKDILDREDDAKKLLEEAGVTPGSLSIELRYNKSENHQKTMTAVANMLKGVGIGSTMVEMEGTGYFDYMKQDQPFDMSRAGWIADYSDPQNFLFLFQTDNPGFNYPRWSNKEYDGLMEQAAKTIDLDARAKLLRQAEEIFLKDMPAIPILYYSANTLVSKNLTGWEDNAADEHPSRFMAIGG